MELERYSGVIGLPVICSNNGKKVGNVKDLIFCPRNKEVRAFLLNGRSYDVAKKVVFLESVLNIGRDVIIIDENSNVISMKKPDYEKNFYDEGKILGLNVYSKSGQELGTVKDILFDQETGMVEGVEISDGLIQDLVQGRNILPLFGKVEFSEEIILVEKEAIEEISHTGGGIKKKLLREQDTRKE